MLILYIADDPLQPGYHGPPPPIPPPPPTPSPCRILAMPPLVPWPLGPSEPTKGAAPYPDCPPRSPAAPPHHPLGHPSRTPSPTSPPTNPPSHHQYEPLPNPSPPNTHRLLRAGERAARRGGAAGAATAGAAVGGVGGLCSRSHASIRLRSACGDTVRGTYGTRAELRASGPAPRARNGTAMAAAYGHMATPRRARFGASELRASAPASPAG